MLRVPHEHQQGDPNVKDEGGAQANHQEGKTPDLRKERERRRRPVYYAYNDGRCTVLYCKLKDICLGNHRKVHYREKNETGDQQRRGLPH